MSKLILVKSTCFSLVATDVEVPYQSKFLLISTDQG
jgi:hypothetical protein